MAIKNLLTDIPARSGAEIFESLLNTASFRLERIISTGQATSPGEWYDQDEDEWVVLLSGKAALRFEKERETHVLQSGDSLLIPSHVRHRVEWTAAGTETIWLALHFKSAADSR